MDINVFIGDIHSIKKDKFEEYCMAKGISAEVSPQFDIDSQTGFLPIKLQTGLIDNSLKDKQYLTGFELDIDTYDYKNEFRFNNYSYIFNKEIDSVLERCSYVMTVSFCGDDSLEPLIAYAFCGYVLKECGGIVFDCESAELAPDAEGMISDISGFLKEQFESGEFQANSFGGWE